MRVFLALFAVAFGDWSAKWNPWSCPSTCSSMFGSNSNCDNPSNNINSHDAVNNQNPLCGLMSTGDCSLTGKRKYYIYIRERSQRKKTYCIFSFTNKNYVEK